MEEKNQMRQSFWQGLARLVVLHQASRGPVYGRRLSKFFREQGYAISPGSLYPLLHRLERAGWLQSRLKVYKGRTRKYYEITPQGQACLEEMRREVAPLVREVIWGEGAASGLHLTGKSLANEEAGQ
jgi:PadR family transcriptional regulator PadR